nr:hypothetical protein [uncultured Undibacterium sp.]
MHQELEESVVGFQKSVFLPQHFRTAGKHKNSAIQMSYVAVVIDDFTPTPMHARFNPYFPLGASSTLFERWRSIFGHFFRSSLQIASYFHLIHVKTASKSVSTIVSNPNGNSGLNRLGLCQVFLVEVVLWTLPMLSLIWLMCGLHTLERNHCCGVLCDVVTRFCRQCYRQF